jgi:hypothetical protein
VLKGLCFTSCGHISFLLPIDSNDKHPIASFDAQSQSTDDFRKDWQASGCGMSKVGFGLRFPSRSIWKSVSACVKGVAPLSSHERAPGVIALTGDLDLFAARIAAAVAAILLPGGYIAEARNMRTFLVFFFHKSVSHLIPT